MHMYSVVEDFGVDKLTYHTVHKLEERLRQLVPPR